MKLSNVVRKLLLLSMALLAILAFFNQTLIRLHHDYWQNEQSKQRSQLYFLPNNISFLDITQTLIFDKSIPAALKEPLLSGKRHIVVFKYLSDGNWVAGYMSYLTHGEHPTLIFLRGGNGYFGIMRPNNRFSYLEGYNVVGTLYRGNIYGGQDEFGGKDVNDVENLIKFFPKLALFTHKQLKPPFTMLGVSRGAMEAFISLSHSNYVKLSVNRAISVSGNVDLYTTLKYRPDMKCLFISKFKQSGEKDFNTWLDKRDPVHNTQYLNKKLNLLLVYGLADERVSVHEQKNLLQALKKEGITSNLITIPDANHGFDNCFDVLQSTIK